MSAAPAKPGTIGCRAEGWGNIDNARDAHYFDPDGRTLCGRYLLFGTPRWEKNQSLGTSPTSGTCKACWKKRAAAEALLS